MARAAAKKVAKKTVAKKTVAKKTVAKKTVAADRYSQIIERVFFDNYTSGARSVIFTRDQFVSASKTLGINRPDNLGDVVYAFRYRRALPDAILKMQPRGKKWVIFPHQIRPSAYRFAAVPFAFVEPTAGLTVTKIPDATPGMIDLYAKGDEQALLAKLRYNRLLDVYTGVTTYSLQSHLRTTIPKIAQVETDEIYVGVDRHGAHYVFPVQAKGGRDRLNVVQIWQDFKVCSEKFPDSVVRPVAAQFMDEDVICLFTFDWDGGDGITIRPGSERHYKLVPPDELSAVDLAAYRTAVPEP